MRAIISVILLFFAASAHAEQYTVLLGRVAFQEDTGLGLLIETARGNGIVVIANGCLG